MKRRQIVTSSKKLNPDGDKTSPTENKMYEKIVRLKNIVDTDPVFTYNVYRK